MLSLHFFKELALALIVIHASIEMAQEALKKLGRTWNSQRIRIFFAALLLIIWLPIGCAPMIYYTIELIDNTARHEQPANNNVDDKPFYPNCRTDKLYSA